ncbi:MAG TPA: 3-methyl-2-oxobutanoate hydroxymethyltransferase [Alphaproteobacteria bacterium]|nr:3-methyl-2-oxobutanoate hydroxymethyltransferase [Alphaproteobacteria bacterium]
MRLNLDHFTKSAGPFVCLTAYTAPVARLVDPYVDLILVGDSLGMVEYGFDTTLPVTLDMMIAHGAAVVRGSSRAFVVVDMPYGTYEKSPDEALRNARRVMSETGCGAVKLEGGAAMAATVKHLVQNNVPVMGHIGLLPQSVEKMGGYKIQGRDGAQALIVDAKAITEAGAFAIVIEGTVEPVARAITEAVAVPTIGIGASPSCDGQVLVINDLLGLTERAPKFAKRYADLGVAIAEAAQKYAEDVRARRFPDKEHCY